MNIVTGPDEWHVAEINYTSSESYKVSHFFANDGVIVVMMMIRRRMRRSYDGDNDDDDGSM